MRNRPVKQLQLKFPGVDFSDIEPGPDPTSTEELESVEHCALRGYESLQWVVGATLAGFGIMHACMHACIRAYIHAYIYYSFVI